MTHHRDRRTQVTPATEARALVHAKVLADLFDRRPDLAGVYPPADLTAEAVRWSA
jgi:hypothetical protein